MDHNKITIIQSMDIDCNKLFKEIAGKDGRGGGKPHFITGVINKERITDFVNRIFNLISNINDVNVSTEHFNNYVMPDTKCHYESL
jgi:hypothetical protein